MTPVPEESVSYQEALFRLNDLCGQRVRAAVCDPDTPMLVVEGTLRHDDENAEVWGCYRVDEAKLDVTGFQQYGGHWAYPNGGATSFYGDHGIRVDVVPLTEGDA